MYINNFFRVTANFYFGTLFCVFVTKEFFFEFIKLNALEDNCEQ